MKKLIIINSGASLKKSTKDGPMIRNTILKPSIIFCRGQIDAYFGDHRPPEDFWKILAVYVAHASLYSIKWAERFGQNDIDNMIEICKKSWAHYDNFKNCIPGWYRSD